MSLMTLLIGLMLISFGKAKPMAEAEEVIKSINTDSGNQISIIVGGQDAQKGEFPWLVTLVNGNNRDPVCSGALIEMDLVLTAAHCIYKKDSSKFTVRAGEYNLSKNDGTEQSSKILSWKWHENYINSDDDHYPNDIALIWLSKEFTNTTEVHTLRLQTTDTGLKPTDKAVVAGWGKDADGIVKDILQKVTLDVRDQTQCKKDYLPLEITDKQFCAGSKGKGACEGDSGGPVMCNADDIAVICGIVSFGRGGECAAYNTPGVFTRVSAYISWINENIKSGPPPPSKSPLFTSVMHSPLTLFLLVFCIYK